MCAYGIGLGHMWRLTCCEVWVCVSALCGTRSGVDFGDDNARAAGKSATKRANEEMLQQACEGCQGTVLPVSHAVEMLSSLRSKAVKQVRPCVWSCHCGCGGCVVADISRECVSQTSKFRGVLEVTPELSIPVWSIGKIAEAKLPSLSKLSVPALEAGGDSCKARLVAPTLAGWLVG